MPRPKGFAEKGFDTWGMARGVHAKLDDPVDKLKQLDIREMWSSHGTGTWTVVYRSCRDNDLNIGLFCAWSHKRFRQMAMERESWDLSVGSGFPGFTKYFNEGRSRTVYLRYGTDPNTVEPLVIIQSHHDVKPDSLPQLSEEFRLYHNLWLDPGGRALVKVEDDGNEYVAAEITESEVRVRTKLLRQFQAARQLDLLLFINSVRHVDLDAEVDFDSLREEIATDLDRSVFVAVGGDRGFSDRPFSRLLAKKVIPAPPRRKAGVWPYDDHPESFPEFIVGEGDDGELLTFTCDPGKLANYFGANPDAPHYLTPVFFRREVLQRYFDHSEKYSVVDGYLSCGGLWGVSIDNDHPHHVMVFLGDLGRDLPESERDYWRSFNVTPSGNMSATAFRRSILNQFTSPDAPDLQFKWIYQRFRERWVASHGWDLFLPLSDGDAHVFQRLRIPLSESQAEFDGQILGLAKLLVDVLNQKHLGTLVGATVPNEQSIARLERWLTDAGYPSVDRDVGLLRRVQLLRSKGAAHKKGSEYERIVAREVGSGTKSALVARLLGEGAQMLNGLATHFSVDLDLA